MVAVASLTLRAGRDSRRNRGSRRGFWDMVAGDNHGVQPELQLILATGLDLQVAGLRPFEPRQLLQLLAEQVFTSLYPPKSRHERRSPALHAGFGSTLARRHRLRKAS